MKAHHREETDAEHFGRTVLAQDENVRRDISLVHAVGREYEAAENERLDPAGGRDVAALSQRRRALSRARQCDDGLWADSKSEDYG